MPLRSSRGSFRILFVVAMCLAVTADAAPFGLVLSGGGARGAYEVGVWQELQAAGLASRVTAISGTSVGAINAALFAVRTESAERIWLEKMDGIFLVNTNRVGESLQKTLDDASKAIEVAKETGEDWKGLVSFALKLGFRIGAASIEAEPRTGYIDSSMLAEALDETLPQTWPAASPAVYATAVESMAGVSKTWRLNAESHARRVLMLRASAAIPLGFDSVKIDGKVYVDGGWEANGGNNVPLSPILDHHPEIKTAFVVYLKDERHLDSSRRARNREDAAANGVRLVEIVPSEDVGGAFGVGGVFDTSPETVRRLIDLGRRDARKTLAEYGEACSLPASPMSDTGRKS